MFVCFSCCYEGLHVNVSVSGSQQGQRSELCTGMQSTQPLVMVEPLNLLHLLTLPKTLTNADTKTAVQAAAPLPPQS